MSAYDEAVNHSVDAFDRYHLCMKETQRRADKLAAAEVDFLNATDEQHAAYEDAMAAFARMRELEPQTKPAQPKESHRDNCNRRVRRVMLWHGRQGLACCGRATRGMAWRGRLGMTDEPTGPGPSPAWFLSATLDTLEVEVGTADFDTADDFRRWYSESDLLDECAVRLTAARELLRARLLAEDPTRQRLFESARISSRQETIYPNPLGRSDL